MRTSLVYNNIFWGDSDYFGDASFTLC